MDRAVGIAAADRLDEWKEDASLTAARKSQREITRFEGALAILHMAVFLGEDYSEFNSDWIPYDDLMGNKMWAETEEVWAGFDVKSVLNNPYPYDLGGFEKTTYVYEGWDAGGVAIRYMTGRVSFISGETLLEFDYENNSLHLNEKITALDAMLAVARLLDSTADSKEDGMLDVLETAIRHYNESIITSDLLDFTIDMPDVSDENVPNWHGIVWVANNEYNATDIDTNTFDKMA